MSRKRDFRRIFRGLRPRLALSYAILFTVLLTGVALAFRVRLANTLDNQTQEELKDDWAAMKGYMRIEPVTDLATAFVPPGITIPKTPTRRRSSSTPARSTWSPINSAIPFPIP